MDEAMLDSGAGRGQVALRHRDAQSGFAKYAVAQCRARLDHRAKHRYADTLGFGVSLGDKHVPPYPALRKVSSHALPAVPGGVHRLAIKLDAAASDVHRLDVH